MYPVFLDVGGRLCLVIGGGTVASRKVAGLLAEGALVRLISPEVVPELAALAGDGKIEWQRRTYADGDLTDAFLVFAATDDVATQVEISRRAQEEGQLINVADDPASCNFQVPASCRRGDLTIAVSTNGKSPALAALIRERLEAHYGREYEVLLDIMAQVRGQLGEGEDTQAQRKKIYKKILHSDILDWIRSGQVEKIRNHLENVLGPEVQFDYRKLKLNVL